VQIVVVLKYKSGEVSRRYRTWPGRHDRSIYHR